jgi:CelD/BcsL family acetyltransferase involved in cellulose biosynthesis
VSSVTFAVHESVEEIAALETTWRELHKKATYPSIYNSFDFFISSVKNFSEPDVKLFVLSARYEGVVIAVFPFQLSLVTVFGTHLTRLEYAAQWESDKPYPLFERGFEELGWQELFRFLTVHHHCRWDEIELCEVRDGLPAAEQLPKLFSSPLYWVRIKQDRRSPIVALDQPWEARWSAHRKMRKKIIRIQKTFGDRLRFEVVDGTGNWLDYLKIYVEIESRGWKAGRVGISKDARTLNFYQDLFGSLAKRNQICFGILSVDNQPVAVEIAYLQDRVVYFAHGTFDEAYSRYSPGMVSTALFLRHFHNRQWCEGDYLAGYAGYVVPWSDRVVSSRRMIIRRLSAHVIYTLAAKGLRKLMPSHRKHVKTDEPAANL